MELSPIRKEVITIKSFKRDGAAFSLCSSSDREILIVRTGIGPQRAYAAARQAAAFRPLSAVVSVGLASALQPSMEVGDLVIGDRFFFGEAVYEGDHHLAERAVKALDQRGGIPYVRGPIMTVGKVVGTAGEKKALRDLSQAVALDMESAAVARAAQESSLPVLAVRAVSDRADEDLGLDVGHYLTPQGSFRVIHGLWHLMTHWTAFSRLMELRRQALRAAQNLGLFFRFFLESLG